MRESLLRPLQIIILLSALALSACTSVTDLKDSLSERLFGRESNEEPSELTEIKSTAQAKVLWNNHLGASEDNDFTPALDNGFVYGASANGELVKLVATDGKQNQKNSETTTTQTGSVTSTGPDVDLMKKAADSWANYRDWETDRKSVV